MPTAGSKRRKKNLAAIAIASQEQFNDDYRKRANPAVAIDSKPIANVDFDQPVTQTDEHGNSWTITFKQTPGLELTGKKIRDLTKSVVIPHPTVILEQLPQPKYLENGLTQTHTGICYNTHVTFETAPGWICVA